MHLAVKRQHMVLTQAEELNVLHDHHLVVFHAVDSTVHYLFDILGIPARQITQRLFHSLRRAQQPVTFRIFTDRFQHAADQGGYRLRWHYFHHRLFSVP